MNQLNKKIIHHVEKRFPVYYHMGSYLTIPTKDSIFYCLFMEISIEKFIHTYFNQMTDVTVNVTTEKHLQELFGHD